MQKELGTYIDSIKPGLIEEQVGYLNLREGKSMTDEVAKSYQKGTEYALDRKAYDHFRPIFI